MLTYTLLDPADADAVAAWYDLYVAARRAFDPTETVATGPECRELLTANAGRRLAGFLAYDGSVLVGSGTLSLRLQDNTDRVGIIVNVAPDHLGEHIGTEMLAFAEELARDRGRAHADLQIRCDEAAALAVAQQAGYRTNQISVESRLDLPVDPARLDRLEADAAGRAAAYELRLVHGPLPADLLPSYCATKNRIYLDAPTGDVELQAGGLTPELAGERDRALELRGDTRITAVALDPSYNVVGLSEIIVLHGQRHLVQAATIVAPEARGHRLGLALKVLTTRAAAETGRSFIVTDNAETNSQMRAINDALGFRCHSQWAELTKPLARQN